MVLFFGTDSEAQVLYDPAQITGLPMHYIPSFAGNLGSLRIASESQLYHRGTAFNDFYSVASIDGFMPKISSGLGGFVSFYDPSAAYYNLNYKSTAIGLVIAPKISIKGKYTISPGLSVTTTYIETKREPYEYYTVDPGYGTIFVPRVYKEKYRVSETVSLLVNTKKLYLGTAFNSELQNFSTWQLSIQAGATFQRTETSKFSFSPNILWIVSNITDRNEQSSFSIGSINRQLLPFNANLNFRYRKVLFGIGPGFMAGFQSKNFRFMYTTNQNLSSHSITLRVLFNHKDSQKINY